MRNIVILSISLVLTGCITEKKTLIQKQHLPSSIIKHAPISKECINNKPAVVAIIDTGLRMNDLSVNAHLCKFGHKDFTREQKFNNFPNIETPVPEDSHGHGTNITGLIENFAGNKNYCIVILKYYSPRTPGEDNMKNTIDAITYATNIGVKYINYSGGGIDYSKKEADAVKKFLDRGGHFIAAAGNEYTSIEKTPYYPAKDDSRVISVGNLDRDGNPARSSNKGPSISRWEPGTQMKAFGLTMTGTSQATAVATGKIIKESECDK